jgi:peptidoglycan lytic transglycosylase
VAAFAALGIGAVLVSTGCLHRHHHAAPMARRYPPPTPPPAGPTPAARIEQGETGLASWYGHPYHGRPTASGEIYNMYDITAAHRTLPFGTRVRVHNLENGRTVDVRINDRGPFVAGRIIDLSYSAAQAIGMPGIARVQLEILGSETPGSSPPPAGIYAVQVGAFADPTNAQRLKDLIEPRHGPVSIEKYDRGDGVFYRVRVGRVSSIEAANQLAQDLRNGNLATDTFVVRVN